MMKILLQVVVFLLVGSALMYALVTSIEAGSLR